MSINKFTNNRLVTVLIINPHEEQNILSLTAYLFSKKFRSSRTRKIYTDVKFVVENYKFVKIVKMATMTQLPIVILLVEFTLALCQTLIQEIELEPEVRIESDLMEDQIWYSTRENLNEIFFSLKS